MSTWYDQRKTKYGNKPTTHAGMPFASKGEASCYDFLKLLEKAGELEVVKTQDYVYLTDARIPYIADFRLKLKSGEDAWAEFKGFETDVWRIKRRLWQHYGPGPLFVYKKRGSQVVLFETLMPKTKLL